VFVIHGNERQRKTKTSRSATRNDVNNVRWIQLRFAECDSHDIPLAATRRWTDTESARECAMRVRQVWLSDWEVLIYTCGNNSAQLRVCFANQ